MAQFKPPASTLVGMLWLVSCTAAAGEETVDRNLSLSGFGTLGVVHSSEDRADFGSSIFVPHGAGHTRQWSPEVDSRLGAQLIGAFTPELSATLQLIAEQRHDGEYVPHVEWANIKYQITPQLSIRFGRTALASFLVSDFRKVGYANPWVRPPGEVYGLVPVANSDGVDASYKLQRGNFVHTLQGSYGQTKVKLAAGGVTKGRNQWVVSDTIESGPVTLRIAYLQAYVSNDGLHALFDTFRQFGPRGVALAEQYDPNDKKVTFVGAGGAYDPGDWFVMAEWGNVNFRSAIGERTAWYASAGYRIETFTPYITYARTMANSNRSDPGLNIAEQPPQQAGAAAGLNAALNGLLATNPVQQAISAGARWDFMKNVALKLQYDHNNLGAGSAGTLGNLQPDFQPGGTVNLFSATLDFVW
jgi:predicted porin